MGCGLLLIAAAIALVASVYAVKGECPPQPVVCGEGQGLVVFAATPVVFVGVVLATIGAVMLKAGRRKG